MTTDISEKGLETLIMRHLTGTDGLAAGPGLVAETPEELRSVRPVRPVRPVRKTSAE